MRADIFDQYYQAIPVIRARETLNDMAISAYPHSKQQARSKMHKSIHKVAYPNIWENAPKMTLDQFFGKPKVNNGQ